MLFCPDPEEDGKVYVDLRRGEGMATHFEPCQDCWEAMDFTRSPSPFWHEAELCAECYTAAEIHDEIAAARGERLEIMDSVRDLPRCVEPNLAEPSGDTLNASIFNLDF